LTLVTASLKKWLFAYGAANAANRPFEDIRPREPIACNNHHHAFRAAKN
jgi:hypothetical protein